MVFPKVSVEPMPVKRVNPEIKIRVYPDVFFQFRRSAK